MKQMQEQKNEEAIVKQKWKTIEMKPFQSEQAEKKNKRIQISFMHCTNSIGNLRLVFVFVFLFSASAKINLYNINFNRLTIIFISVSFRIFICNDFFFLFFFLIFFLYFSCFILSEATGKTKTVRKKICST